MFRFRPRRSALVHVLVPILLASLVASTVPAATGAEGTGLVSGASVTPRVFSPNGDGVDDEARLHFEVGHEAAVSVEVIDFAGTRVRALRPAGSVPAGPMDVAWNGRSDTGRLVLDGGYRFLVRATDGAGTTAVRLPFTKAARAIYPAAPDAIVIALDAGHGGADPGAVRNRFAEKTVTLDIVRRLRAMLEGAGVRVVTTRTSDSRVNVRGVDWSGDGKVGYMDELAARVETANSARAAVFLCIHANSSRTPRARGTSTYLYANRTFGSSSRVLAGLVQSRLLANLAPMRTLAWRPVDRGLHSYDFYVLNGYNRYSRPRPTLMPGVLAETLYISNPGDRSILRSAAGRQRLAIGFYESLERYFASRTYGATYELLGSAPGSLDEGANGTLDVRVRNTSSRAWADGGVAARLAWVPAVRWYDGTTAAGTELARLPLPALAPGESVDLSIPFTAPAAAALAPTGGRGLLKLDLVSGTTRFATAGVVPYQVAFTVTGAPTPTPTPSPTPTPEPTPTPSPTAVPTASATAVPTEAPSASPTATPTPTASPTPTPAASPTATPTPTPTPTASLTATPTPTPTASPDGGVEASSPSSGLASG